MQSDKTDQGTAVERAVTALRQHIIGGVLSDADRITETSGARMLGMSRTPLREALRQLEQEGFLEKLDGRGYRLRQIDPQDIIDASAVRGALEALAAGALARKGVSAAIRDVFRQSLEMSEQAISRLVTGPEEVGLYQQANRMFHDTIIRAAGNRMITVALERVSEIPLVVPGAYNADPEAQDRFNQARLSVGHSQHVIIIDAILSGDAVRAEHAMREHANAPVRYAALFGKQEPVD